ncbi:MAG: hypothetical protein DKM50_08235 [Candidatus Margulisiibacteriota bacterium]|nr:MAG: hypothetical protein A2X43_03015 [Candidatus Margulisbacteria bacterium GWD2_39_127]OGI02618.1 MAG: hypothetical protein A2X42_10950 [Candidatus Margulisbacteria bacterium GWF2_38_17]OGI10769.1 MAG: hypothetical protein A2X41_10435 [Candidatus Margulisbacteria bacterium GWE2_39_32]PZM79583.1 MAG: hypothetical protein DKM50_08235 [Candidatus Margulisiibacteriota bacterium]HAR63235.1 hypothetical protein [Candidatus Margulisiibacteriota bacterium]
MYKKIMAGDVASGNRIVPQQTQAQIAEVARASMLQLIEKLGTSYNLNHEYGINTKAVLVSYEGVSSLGVDLSHVFEGLEVPKAGFVLNLRLDKQKALLDAVIKKYPELKEELGFYNLEGSKAVYKKMREQNDHLTDIMWFWTGEIYTYGKRNDSEPVAGIVNSDKIGDLKESYFYIRTLEGDYWDVKPGECSPSGALVLGIKLS